MSPARTNDKLGPQRKPRGLVVLRFTLALLAATVLLVVSSAPVLAHGFEGGQATLEGIPSWLYLGAGASVVLASFALVGRFAIRDTGVFTYRSRQLAVDVSILKPLARIATVLLYVGVIALGFLGPNQLHVNAAPTFFVEVFWWVSYGIFAILVGNVWSVINPWKTIFEWAGEPSLNRRYPVRLGAMPALVLFLLFAWLNMVVAALGSPWLVGVFALGYGCLMFLGMAVYGKDDWLWNADAFTRVFDFFGRFAPLVVTADGVTLRGYAVGLVEDAVHSSEEIMLVVAMLFVLSFDGFKETPAYFDLLLALSPGGMSPIVANALVGGVLMLGGFAVFVGAYLGVSLLMKRAAGATTPVGEVMGRFVLTLVPIAIAYHIAHYSLYYVLQHEQLIQVLVNPLPGTELPASGLPAFIAPTAVWYYMVALIVGGHVVAVWVAHHASLSFFEARRAAIRSQLPMMVLMVFYTVVSLWIISQPFGG